VHADLEALLKLQGKDKIVMDLEAELAALEPELQQLDDELGQAEESLGGARSRVDEADKRRQDLEGKIESYRVMQERRRQRLEWVRGAKEASNLMAELDLARTAQGLAAEEEQRLEEIRAGQSPKREEIAAKQAEIGDKLQAARADRAETAKPVPSQLQDRYNRIRQGRAPLALYPIHNGACGHCYTSVPLHRRQKVLGGSGVEPCEACGVLIYDGGE
jgi:predicted  nucleic acid-binding Zn-ribbon protein